jgi:apolipoprotein N-acyltransferase
MHIPDPWSLLTGIASLISLSLAAGEKFASWREYILPAATALGGFAIGRISPSLSSGMDQLFSDPRVAGFILLIFLIIVALASVAYLLMRRGQLWLAYSLFFMGMVLVPTSIMSMYFRIADSIPPGDLIKLAQIKATSGEYEQAVKYLESAKDKTNNDVLKKELQIQIDALIKEAAKISIGRQAK